MEQNLNETKLIDKKDLDQAFYRWWIACEMSNSYERLQSVAFCYSMIPVLKKLYTKKEDLCQALTRQLAFFNTEGTWGSPIHGMTIAMEEQKSMGDDIPDSVFNGLKTGLMGPLAGIGDTIDWGTLKTIIYGIAVTFAAAGSILGGIIPVLFTILTVIIGKNLLHLGYNLGRESVKSILHSGLIEELISGTSIMGLFMMGALSAQFVKLTTPLTIPTGSGNTMAVQSILDSIAPGILPLCIVFGLYWVIANRKQNYAVISIGIIFLCLLGALIGIF